MTDLTQERLRELLDYDPATGIFRWRLRRRCGAVMGDIAGTVTRWGYVQIRIDRRAYRASRLAWFYVHGRWPTPTIDHINRCRGDDRICNLREATALQNAVNRAPKRPDGLKGFYQTSGGRFKAQIRVAKKIKCLGTFATAEQAGAAYRAAAEVVHGEYARVA